MENSENISYEMNENKYKATKLWNDLIYTFQTRMSCKTNRRNLRSYSNCFTGTAAVTVMHSILKENRNFTVQIKRIQAVKLLRKFLERHVIEDINGKWEYKIFSDNNKLFRFPVDPHIHKSTVVSAKTLNRTGALLLFFSKKRKMTPRKALQFFSPAVVKRYATRSNDTQWKFHVVKKLKLE